MRLYQLHDGYSNSTHYMEREYGINPKTMAQFGGNWVLRTKRNGEYVDHDRYRTDLAERNNIELVDTDNATTR